jgi:hypothetical protein
LSRRHRPRLLPDGRNLCSAERCGFTGTSAEITAHVRYGVKRSPDGSWSGPANLTAASFGEMMGLLGLSNA